VTADKVLKETAALAFADLRVLFDSDGRLLPPTMWPDHVAAAVSSFKVLSRQMPGSDPVEMEYVIAVKTWDKVKALELLGRHMGLCRHDNSRNETESIAEALDRRMALTRGLLIKGVE
jgi:phage terminase small subunit